MKTASKLVSLMLLVTAAGAAQTQIPNTQTLTSDQQALALVQTAAQIAGNVQQASLNGFLALYIPAKDWDTAARDSDLGPFLKLKQVQPKEGRSAACLFSESKTTAICVYFDGATPFGVAAAKAGSSGKMEASDVAAAYKPVTKEMLDKKGQKPEITPVEGIATDDGLALTAFIVRTKEASQ